MMRFVYMAVIAARLCAIDISAANTENVSMYEWRSRISGVSGTGELHKVLLPPDMLDGLRSYPMDVRILDEQGRAWPALIWSMAGDQIVGTLRAEEVISPNTSNEYERVYKVSSVSRGELGHNQVILSLGGKNFICRADVYGGASIDDMDLLATTVVVEQNAPFPLRKRTIDYPESDASFIKVVLHADARGREISDVQWRATDVALVRREADDAEMFSYERVAGDEAPELMFTAGARNRPVMFIDINAGIENTSIPLRVYGRANNDASWRWIADGGIHAYGDVRYQRIAMNRADYPEIKVEFIDGGTTPLRIRRVEGGAVPHYLLFEPQSEGKAYLYYGTDRYQLPSSAFVRSVDEAAVRQAPEAEISRRSANPARKVNSLRDYRMSLLNLGLVIIGGSIALAAARIMHRRYFS